MCMVLDCIGGISFDHCIFHNVFDVGYCLCKRTVRI